MPREPGRLAIVTRYGARECDLEGTLVRRNADALVRYEWSRSQSVSMVNRPVELLLLSDQVCPPVRPDFTRANDHAASGVVRKQGSRQRGGCQRSDLVSSPSSDFDGSSREREILELGGREFISRLPCFIADPASDATVSLVVADLLEPEAGRGGVEHAEQLVVVVFRRIRRQLDHRRRTVEHLPAAIQHEVVVRRHKRKRDQQLRVEPHLVRQDVGSPPLTAILASLTEGETPA